MWPLTIINVATYYYYFFLIFNFLNTPGSKDSRGEKLKKAKIKMSDGHRSGRSTGRVSCKSMELKRCSMIEMHWNNYYFYHR